MRNKILSVMLIFAMLLLSACSADNDTNTAEQTQSPPFVFAVEESAVSDNSTPDYDSNPIESQEPEETKEPEDTVKPVTTQLTAVTAYEQYSSLRELISVTSAEDSQCDMDMFMNMEIAMDLFGQRLAVNTIIDGNFKVAVKGDDIKYSAVMNTKIPGLSENSMIIQYNGADWYIAADGEQMEITEDEIMEYLGAGVAVGMPEFDAEAVTTAETEIIDGFEVTTLIIDTSAIMDYVPAGSSSFEELGLDELMEMYDNIDISDIVIIMTSDSDGTPVSMKMDMTYSIEGMMEIAIDCLFVFNQFDGVEPDLSMLSGRDI